MDDNNIVEFLFSPLSLCATKMYRYANVSLLKKLAARKKLMVEKKILLLCTAIFVNACCQELYNLTQLAATIPLTNQPKAINVIRILDEESCFEAFHTAVEVEDDIDEPFDANLFIDGINIKNSNRGTEELSK
ncbi:hypothetical protein DAPPUDRAFT_316497 [Daphnia pulex]|uniref:Uncharacterized protein n=1 Tax=Daphnia pulex TaxID=6669 RepID=E9GD41_DAPPU|nr:hypothetical protein DAPPUDRAFT_316497 [Daphnia pulex]|eukprot:EFX82759.1 hypothetical protein DAPPUDRAFT_316497 [Daphnia pulex]